MSFTCLAGLALASASSGCVGRRYVEETLYGPGRRPRVHTEPMEVPDARQEAFDAAMLANAPPGIQAAFRREHPRAAVTRVEQHPAGGGFMLYRVTYVEDGLAGSEVYRPDGNPVYEPEYVWVGPRPDDFDYRPPVRSATRPVMPNMQ